MKIERNIYLDKLKNKMWNGQVKVVVGLRRSGKTYLLFDIFKPYLIQSGVNPNNIIELKLDLPQNRHIKTLDKIWDVINQSVKKDEKYYVLIDEIQQIPDFKYLITGLYEMKNVDAYVTGSNSKSLSSDIETEMRGRGDTIHVRPFSFSEFSSVYNDMQKAWNDYQTFGGLPEILKGKTNEEKCEYLKDEYQNTFAKDLIERHANDKMDELIYILNVLASNIGSLSNPNRIANCLKSIKKAETTFNQIKKYIKHIKDSYLINEALRYDVKGNSYFDTPLKYYFEDIGIRNAILNFRDLDPTHLLENIIYNELLYRGFNVDIGIINAVEKNNKTKKSERKTYEIDFVANKIDKKYYIQVALKLQDDNYDRELRPLKKIDDSFKKIIITDTDMRTITQDGILIIGIKEFLLNPRSLDM